MFGIFKFLWGVEQLVAAISAPQTIVCQHRHHEQRGKDSLLLRTLQSTLGSSTLTHSARAFCPSPLAVLRICSDYNSGHLRLGPWVMRGWGRERTGLSNVSPSPASRTWPWAVRFRSPLGSWFLPKMDMVIDADEIWTTSDQWIVVQRTGHTDFLL